jgi:hypothetical protein
MHEIWQMMNGRCSNLNAPTKHNMSLGGLQPTTQLRTHAISASLLHLAFPDHGAPPSRDLELSQDSSISLDISVKLGLPPSDIAGRHGRKFAALMPVPKAPMNEHNRFVARQYYIGPAWKFPCVEPKPESKMMKCLAQGDLGLGVTATNAGHHAGARFRIDYVSHAIRKND